MASAAAAARGRMRQRPHPTTPASPKPGAELRGARARGRNAKRLAPRAHLSTATCAPSRARASHTARPMPRAPPVTTARWPRSSAMSSPLPPRVPETWRTSHGPCGHGRCCKKRATYRFVPLVLFRPLQRKEHTHKQYGLRAATKWGFPKERLVCMRTDLKGDSGRRTEMRKAQLCFYDREVGPFLKPRGPETGSPLPRQRRGL